MVGENFEIHLSQMAKNASKLSMFGENFEIHLAQMAKNASKLSSMIEENLKIARLKWLKMHLNYPP